MTDLGAPVRPMDVGGRLGRLRERLDTLGPDDASGVDALVVTNLTNIRYLTGFTGSAGLVVVTPDRAVLVTDGRYGEQAPAQVAAAGAPMTVEVSGTEQDKIVASALTGAGRVGTVNGIFVQTFNQGGTLTAKFGIRHTPAVVSAAGTNLKISEVPLPPATATPAPVLSGGGKVS